MIPTKRPSSDPSSFPSLIPTEPTIRPTTSASVLADVKITFEPSTPQLIGLLVGTCLFLSIVFLLFYRFCLHRITNDHSGGGVIHQHQRSLRSIKLGNSNRNSIRL
jgi:hypothetical protein